LSELIPHTDNSDASISSGWRIVIALTGLAITVLAIVFAIMATEGLAALIIAPAVLFGARVLVLAAFADELTGEVILGAFFRFTLRRPEPPALHQNANETAAPLPEQTPASAPQLEAHDFELPTLADPRSLKEGNATASED
jgi:hypothetical protein